MQPDVIRFQCRPGPRLLLAALLAAGSFGVLAQDDPNPYYFGVSQAFTHDSNVFRLPTNAQSDNYTSTGLVAGVDQPFGRQRFFANGNVYANRFNDLSTLDNTSYGLNAGLDLSTIERISGDVRLSLNENLATYSTTNQLQLTARNIQNTERLQARVRLGGASLLTLEAGYTHQQLRYSAPEYDRFENKQDAVNFGLRYRPSGLLTLGTALRHTEGQYPNVSTTGGGDYGFKRDDLDLTAAWVPTGRSTVAGRLSFGRQQYESASSRDFSGTTGELSWRFRPTGKLTFQTTASRDTGNETSFLTLNDAGTTTTIDGDNSRLTTALRFDTTYAATAKINATAGVNYVRRSLADVSTTSNGVILPSAEGKDTIRSYSLGVAYAPSRAWLLACNFRRDMRSISDNTPLFLSYPYSANTASCSAQLTIQ